MQTSQDTPTEHPLAVRGAVASGQDRNASVGIRLLAADSSHPMPLNAIRKRDSRKTAKGAAHDWCARMRRSNAGDSKTEQRSQSAFSRVAPAGVNADRLLAVVGPKDHASKSLGRRAGASESATTQTAPTSAIFTAFSFHIQ